jgi:uncharacterized protein (TIGR00730 family)
MIRSICVYCGSQSGANPIFQQQAKILGKTLVENNIELVYGGGNVGLMGILADEVMRLGGRVIGIIPIALHEKEVAHLSITELHIVADMHERKAKMAAISDGFIALPGGLGTLEELFEALTWSQLGFHNKPIGLLNIDHYYDDLIRFLDHSVKQKFVNQKHFDLLIQDDDANNLINKFKILTNTN